MPGQAGHDAKGREPGMTHTAARTGIKKRVEGDEGAAAGGFWAGRHFFCRSEQKPEQAEPGRWRDARSRRA